MGTDLARALPSIPEPIEALACERERLWTLLADESTDIWELQTPFKGWSVQEIIRHLLFWDEMVDLAINQPAVFTNRLATLMPQIEAGNLLTVERRHIEAAGPRLLERWHRHSVSSGKRWRATDPKARVSWVSPSMSVKTAISARYMEAWAHGLSVWDAIKGSEKRIETDDIAHIVHMGIATFGWSFTCHGLPAPTHAPSVRLTLPSQTALTYEKSDAESISGSAQRFCQVVTQTRHWRDTDLTVRGTTAVTWMEHAQCFAGRGEAPPAPGQRAL
jgi:uncharacterized protein (TIGR03084 family)